MKEQRKKIFLYNAVILLAALGLYLFLSSSPFVKSYFQRDYDRRIHAKEFTLPVIGSEPGDAGSVSLADLKGSPAVISFWASWCHVCRSELPALADINKELAGLGLQPVLSVASYDDAMSVRQTERFQMGQFRYVLDKNGDVAQLWKVRALPHTIVLDREGVVRMSVSGALTAMKVEEIRAVLGAIGGKTTH